MTLLLVAFITAERSPVTLAGSPNQDKDDERFLPFFPT